MTELDCIINHPEGLGGDIPGRSAFEEPGIEAFHRSLPGCAPTPLIDAAGIAAELGLGKVFIKDEAHRCDVKAFKILGASWAVHRLLREDPGIATFATATDGNHGMALATAARLYARRAAVFMPRGTAKARVERIRATGAVVEVLEVDYDETVRHAAATAEREGWTLVQDTAWPGYEAVPALIQAGYLTLFREAAEQLGALGGDPGIDLVLLPVGVGSLAAAGVWFHHHSYGDRRPRLVAVEPRNAGCLAASLAAGEQRSVAAPGTLMAGLNCGTVSHLAWPLLRDGLDGALLLDDEAIPPAMRRYAALEPVVVSGESGAAGLAALTELLTSTALEPLRRHLRLSPYSRALVLNTEGDTDPAAYRRLIEGAFEG